MIGRRGVLAGGLMMLAAPALGQTRPKPRPDRSASAVDAACAQYIKAAKLGGAVGYAVADLATGQILGGAAVDVPMPPASVTKALTALFALDRLGAGKTFVTRVMATGPVQGGKVQGDLILCGGGDPSLDTDRLGDMTAALARSGLRGITGRFLVYGGALPYAEQIADDQPDFVGYNPAISGMILNYNRANFVWSAKGGALALAVNAEGTRFVPPVHCVQVTLAQREAPLFVYEGRAPVEAWSVAAPALRKDGSRWLPVRAPLPYAGDVFGALCAAQGIKLPAADEIAALPAGAQVLAEDRSANLEVLIKGMLKYSTNLTAESLGLAASGAPSIAASAAAMRDWARARFGISARFGDHSGLGPVSSCTPADMMRVMLGAKDTALVGLMREKGVDGEGREAQGAALRVFAKSGTLNFCSNLAGYVTAPSGRALAFAIFAADGPRRAALPIDQREDPVGGSAWNKRARAMQRAMIAAWGKAYL
jgi:D-alanyl-D-alanine carboxypeptidase/D-alanyl-D-alanine-endopeptidase (penicillin-binding protein 4)